MKTKIDLSARFAKWRKNQRIGAVALVSLSAQRQIATGDEKDSAAQIRATVAARQTVDTLTDGEDLPVLASQLATDESEAEQDGFALSGYLLTRAEKARLAREIPARVKPVTVAPVADLDTLPADYVPVTVGDYDPLIPADILSPSELAAIASEAAREIADLAARDTAAAAAVDFVSELDGHPVDYAPGVSSTVRPVAAVSAPQCEFEILRRAVLGLT